MQPGPSRKRSPTRRSARQKQRKSSPCATENPVDQDPPLQSEVADMGMPEAECQVCYKQYPIIEFSPGERCTFPGEDYVGAVCPQRHFFCSPCMSRYIRQADSQCEIVCPGYGCQYRLSDDDIGRYCDSFQLTARNRIKRNIAKNLKEETQPCPGKKDGQPCTERYALEEEAVGQAFSYTCRSCATNYCLGCNTIPFHHGKTCDQVKSDRYRLNDIGLARGTKLGLARGKDVLCRCGTYIQKTEGCRHMTCTVPSCQTQFCYLCRRKWPCTGVEPTELCIRCSSRAVRIQATIEHFVCQGRPDTHEFCKTCNQPWDQAHEDVRLQGCPSKLWKRASPTQLAV